MDEDNVADLNSVNNFTPVVEWRDSPTIFADAILAFTISQDAARITLGELTSVPNDLPIMKPVVTIAASGEGWGNILRVLNATLAESRLKMSGAPNE